MSTRHSSSDDHLYSRRDLLRTLALGTAFLTLDGCSRLDRTLPNIILCMADDLGWADTGYNGHPELLTPHLDAMSSEGIRFTRFYAAAPVCSPTRGSCLTGRHPYRYGIFNANVGHLPHEEATLAEILKSAGYTTGHFGKWHLGTLTETVLDSNRGGERGKDHYAPPWEHGFDVCFSTEAKVPTWDPMIKPSGETNKRWWNPVDRDGVSEPYGTRYWTGPDQAEDRNLEGDDSRIIMDRATSFIRQASDRQQPFFTVIWFHSPHWPVVAGSEYRRLYPDQDEFTRNHFGCITAMDEQVGRLRNELEEAGVSGNTMLWFCSDNGPEGTVAEGNSHGAGSAGILRGRKRSLYEGGVRVPGLLVWPDRIRGPHQTDIPCCTSDYLPTIIDLLDLRPEEPAFPMDGISLAPLIKGRMQVRSHPIAFESGGQIALIDDRYKIISTDSGETFELYDLVDDPGESKDLAALEPTILETMVARLTEWRESCRNSREGGDYE